MINVPSKCLRLSLEATLSGIQIITIIFMIWVTLCSNHRPLRKVACSSFVMCPLLALALPRVFLKQPRTVLTRQTRQAVRAINLSIFKIICLWFYAYLWCSFLSLYKTMAHIHESPICI
jgi:hypothetical protein